MSTGTECGKHGVLRVGEHGVLSGAGIRILLSLYRS